MEKQKIFEIIVGHARDILPALETHEFRFDDALKDLGANSLDRSEISVMTLDTLGLRIPLVDLARVTSIGELVDVLHARLHKA
jgi:polyketide biosynthesis acyl carrier protein